MITIKLQGGLGNQMFQYALGRKLALQNNAPLSLDISSYGRDRLRHYSLAPFKIKAELTGVQPGLFSRFSRFIAKKIFRRFHIGWEPAILNKTGDLYLDGFWQSYKYFDDIADTVRNDFSLIEPLEQKYPELLARAGGGNTVSLHIRRTDYLSNKKHQKNFGSLPLSYYEQAIREIEKRGIAPTIFVFTDDPAWVKDNLPGGHPTIFAADHGLADCEELILQSRCRHHIIANSSFSWWGAWLDARPDSLTIAPARWTNTGEPKTDDIIPPSWIKI